MSLKVWLPLDGNLRNLGCSDTIISDYGITLDNNGRIGKCYSFDGVDDYIQLSNLDLNGLSAFSITFWCYPLLDNKYFFLVRGSSQFRICINQNGLSFRDTNNTGTQRTIGFNQTIPLSTWTHIGITYNHGKVTIYINGIQDNYSETYYHDSSTLLDDMTEYRIGRQQSSTGNAYYEGKLNDFRIYDHCLSAAEVHEIAQGLILHYKLDDITNGIIDSSGYGHNGTILNTLATSSDTSRYNISTSFVNNTGGIAVSSMPMNIFNNGNTIAFWIKPNDEAGQRSVYCSSYSGTTYSLEKTTGNKLRAYWNGSPDKNSTILSISDDEWQHIAAVKSEDKTKIELYKNGEYIETLNGTFNDKTWSGTYRLGRDSRTTNISYIGLMSDFRIYCTPLLDTDIKLLYNTSCRVDNLKNIHSFEIKETASNNENYIDFTDIIQTDNIGEIKKITANIDTQQEGTDSPSLENIRYFTGITSINIHNTGLNIWGGEDMKKEMSEKISTAVLGSDEDGEYIRYAAGYMSGKIFLNKFKPNTRYTCIFALKKNINSKPINLRIRYTDGTSTNLSRKNTTIDTLDYCVYTTSATKSVKQIEGTHMSGTITLYYNISGIFEGVITENEFKEYIGSSSTLSWENEIGNIYGGKIEINNNTTQLIINKLITTIDSSATIITLSAGKYYIENAFINPVDNGTKISSHYNYSGNIDKSSELSIDNSFYTQITSSYNRFWIYDSSLPTSEDLIAVLEQNPIQVVYEIKDPIIYNFSPIKIKLLKGLNNLWGNTGDIALEYYMIQNTKITKKGQLISNDFNENNKTSFYKNGLTETNEFIEM